MEKQPKFLRDFSKENFQEERDETAKIIQSKRAKAFQAKSEISAQKEGLGKEISTNKEKIQEQLKVVEELNTEIEDLNENGIKRLLNYFKLKKIKAELTDNLQEHTVVLSEKDELANKEKVLELQNDIVSTEFEKARRMVDDFYTSQREKWAHTEYNIEEVKKYFSEDFLKTLSIEDLVILLRRFPNEMVTHVTRQGIRDHTGHISHTAGFGEFSNGFQRIIEDGRLRSPLGVYLVEKEKEKAIAKFLRLSEFETREEAIEELEWITKLEYQGEAGTYVDKSAVHFATEDVADSYYGSEIGNEIFLVFPSAHIASQYYFSGQLNEKDTGYWNDQWVWINEEKGLDINAGLVFIPENTAVNKETGSRYELNIENKPIVNEEYMNGLRKLVSWSEFEEFAKEVESISDDENLELERKVDLLKERLAQKLSIKDEKLLKVIFDYNNSVSLRVYKDDPDRIEDEMKNALTKFGILFIETKDPIPSKQYWENYFSKHPDKNPNKIIYYQGNPTEALFTWKQKNNIDSEYKKSNDPEVGITGSRIDRTSPLATIGLSHFKELALKVIEDYYTE